MGQSSFNEITMEQRVALRQLSHHTRSKLVDLWNAESQACGTAVGFDLLMKAASELGAKEFPTEFIEAMIANHASALTARIYNWEEPYESERNRGGVKKNPILGPHQERSLLDLLDANPSWSHSWVAKTWLASSQAPREKYKDVTHVTVAARLGDLVRKRDAEASETVRRSAELEEWANQLDVVPQVEK